MLFGHISAICYLTIFCHIYNVCCIPSCFSFIPSYSHILSLPLFIFSFFCCLISFLSRKFSYFRLLILAFPCLLLNFLCVSLISFVFLFVARFALRGYARKRICKSQSSAKWSRWIKHTRPWRPPLSLRVKAPRLLIFFLQNDDEILYRTPLGLNSGIW